MDAIIASHLSSITFAATQLHENLALVPILGRGGTGPEYLTLHRAGKQGLIAIGEVSAGGSVPQLRVTNRAELPVLLLDGDELVGAKQNRVVNTSILIPAKAELVVPVSCTESGRWEYRRHDSRPSEYFHTAQLRRTKAAGVSHHLKVDYSYHSEQGEVWNEVSRASHGTGIHSRTNAMHDIFEACSTGIDAYREKSPRVEGQVGFVAVINGRVAGMDLLSRADAWADVHDRLVRGYAMDALTQRASQRIATEQDPAVIAEAFVEQACGLKEARYESVGHGYDHRLSGPSAIGSALVYQDTVIHLCLFADTERAPRRYGIPDLY